MPMLHLSPCGTRDAVQNVSTTLLDYLPRFPPLHVYLHFVFCLAFVNDMADRQKAFKHRGLTTETRRHERQEAGIQLRKEKRAEQVCEYAK